MKARSKAQEEGICMSHNNYWELVFNQCRVNGAEYFGDKLPCNSWDWPKNTFLQRRLNELKKRRWDGITETRNADRQPLSVPGRKRRHVHHGEPAWLRTTGAPLRVEEH
jgi:hypothetical protein